MAGDPNHYKGYQDKFKELTAKGWNGKECEKLPALGSGGMFELKGKSPLMVREFRFFKGKVIACSWAPDSSNVALASRFVVGDQGGQVLIVDAKKGTRKTGYNLSGPSKFVQAVAVHAEKDMVVSGGMDNTISLYKEGAPDAVFLESGKQWAGEGTKGHDGMISSLKWHLEDGNKFFSAGGDGEVKLWDINGGADCVSTFFGHSDESTSITVPRDVPGMNTFATCSNDTTVKIWDTRSVKCVQSLHAGKPEDKLSAADYFPNGNAIAAGGQGQTTYMFDIRSTKKIAEYKRNNMKVTGVAFSKSGRAIYVSHEDGRVIIWDTFGPQENQKYACKHDAHFVSSDPKNPKAGAAPESQITYLGLKPDGEFLATGSFNSDVKIWGGLVAAA